VLDERVLEAGRGLDLAAAVAEMAEPQRLEGVAVALGPGSFTGLRVGVSYGVGLALGRGIPLFGLDSLEMCRARAPRPSRGLVEAGRGRVYHAAEGEEPRLDEAPAVPRDLPASGWLQPRTATALRQAGLHLLDETELLDFGTAAASLLGQAPKLAYGRVRLRYMQPWVRRG
jgi:tRNA A37 threonylcarbamoyladenosine modification protein TsaB